MFIHEPLNDEIIQNIAIEMSLPETAFVLLRDNQPPLLRWFTPASEIDLCGHGTLASAHIYMTQILPRSTEVTFDTKFVGSLKVIKNQDGYTMDFPSRLGKKIALTDIPQFVFDALCQTKPLEAYLSRDLMFVYEDEKIIHQMEPDFRALTQYSKSIIVTATSNGKHDFISRFFCAEDEIGEDPVTGSAHCTLAPYWSQKLGKTHLKAWQASRRGGELILDVTDIQIKITGRAITIMNGSLSIDLST